MFVGFILLLSFMIFFLRIFVFLSLFWRGLLSWFCCWWLWWHRWVPLLGTKQVKKANEYFTRDTFSIEFILEAFGLFSFRKVVIKQTMSWVFINNIGEFILIEFYLFFFWENAIGFDFYKLHEVVSKAFEITRENECWFNFFALNFDASSCILNFL